MARNANGLAPTEGRYRFNQPTFTAVQELIGAIGRLGANVAHFNLDGYDLFFVMVDGGTGRDSESQQRGPRRATPRTNLSPSSSNAPSASLDSIIDAACQLLDVMRADIASKSKSRSPPPLSVARALIARHAPEAGIATVSHSASRMNLNPNSLYVSFERYRKLIPELSQCRWNSFSKRRKRPQRSSQVLLGKNWSKSYPGRTPSDSELGERIARALPLEGNS